MSREFLASAGDTLAKASIGWLGVFLAIISPHQEYLNWLASIISSTLGALLTFVSLLLLLLKLRKEVFPDNREEGVAHSDDRKKEPKKKKKEP